jgi:hypothetical protein
MKKDSFSSFGMRIYAEPVHDMPSVSHKDGSISSRALYVPHDKDKVSDILVYIEDFGNLVFARPDLHFPRSTGFAFCHYGKIAAKVSRPLGLRRSLEVVSRATLARLDAECKKERGFALRHLRAGTNEVGAVLRARAFKACFEKAKEIPKLVAWKAVPCQLQPPTSIVFPKSADGRIRGWLGALKDAAQEAGHGVHYSASLDPRGGVAVIPLYDKLFSRHGFMQVSYDATAGRYDGSGYCYSASPFIGVRKVGFDKPRFEVFYYSEGKAVLLASTTILSRVFEIATREVSKALLGVGNSCFQRDIADTRVYKMLLAPVTREEAIKKCDEVIEHYTREFEVVLKGHLEHERCAQCSTSDAASPGILALLHKLLKIDE